jgi:hypothetical protein
MAEQHGDAIADLEALIEATRRCVDQLEAALPAYRTVLDGLHDGSTVRDALASAGVAEMRLSVTRALEDLENARRVSRVSLMRADLADGSTVKAVAETWAVSRQLVSRYLHGAEGGSG